MMLSDCASLPSFSIAQRWRILLWSAKPEYQDAISALSMHSNSKAGDREAPSVSKSQRDRNVYAVGFSLSVPKPVHTTLGHCHQRESVCPGTFHK
jgi:hypothetical protein